MQKLRRLITAASCLLLIIAMTPAATAQQSNGLPTGSGLSISPTISEFTLKPGASTNVTITLKNITVDDVTATGVVNDFTSDNNTGNPQIITNTTTLSPNSIRNFVLNLNDVPLKRGEQKNVTLGLQVPQNTPPGAYFGVIRYRAVPTGAAAPGPGQVALTASVGTIVLITVPGNIREQVQVSALHVYRGGNDGTFFFGRYTAIASVSYGSGSQVLTIQKNFWYIPLWLLIAVLVVLAVLIFLAYRAYHRYNRDKRHTSRR
jgi:hypothetical protein